MTPHPRRLWDVFADADRLAEGGACECGHVDTEHINGRGPCDRRLGERYCGCRRYSGKSAARCHLGDTG